MTRPLIVVEVESGGHRMIFFAAVARFLRARGVPVALATSRGGLDSDDRRMRTDLAEDEGIEIGGDSSVRGLVRTVAEVQAAHPDREILITEGDKFLPALATTRAPVDHRRLRVLVMRAPRVAGAGPKDLARDLVKATAMRIAARRGVDVRVLEPATTPRAEYRWGRWRSVPDPVDLHTDAADEPPELAHADRTRHWLGVLGHVGPRKNLDLVLDAAGRAGADRFGVHVAGRVEDGEWERCAAALARFRDAGGVLVAADRLLADAALDACLAWVGTAVLAHSSEGPSGILGRAVALGTPVLAAGARTLRADVDRLGAGTWTELDVAAMASALAETVTAACHRPNTTRRALAGSDEFARALLT